jgi:hypothetical protein
MERDLLNYQRSLAQSLDAAMQRVRHLIGDRHWQTDGEHKESVLRQVLRERLPESVAVGRGFVCFPSPASVPKDSGMVRNAEPVTSRQTDILVTSRSEPCLYRDGDLVFVTPEAVRAMIEVKTGLDIASLGETLEKLAKDVAIVRRQGHKDCWAGLFVYEERRLKHEEVLRALLEHSVGGLGAVNCVALGKTDFFRYREDGHSVGSVDGAVWHSYKLKQLAPGYFVSNLAVHLGGKLSGASESLWFPIAGPLNKEQRRVMYASLARRTVEYFAEEM